MQDKNVTTDTQAQELIKEVVNVMCPLVYSTMGPNGDVVVIQSGNGGKVTKDGVTVSKSIFFDDPRREIIGRIVTEASSKTDRLCGDGTTTTSLLLQKLYELHCKYPGFKNHRFIEQVVGRIIHHLNETTIRVEKDSPELYRLALTSSNNDESLSQMIIDLYTSTEGFPEIDFRKAADEKDLVQRTNGLPLKMEYSNPSYAPRQTGERAEINLFFPLVLDDIMRSLNPALLIEILESWASRVYKPYMDRAAAGEKNIEVPHILLIARGIDNEVNSAIFELNQRLGRHNRIIAMQTHFGGSVGSLLMSDMATTFNTPMHKVLSDILVKDIPTEPNRQKVLLGTGRSFLLDIDADTKARLAEVVKDIEESIVTADMSEVNSPRVKFQKARIRGLSSELITVLVGGETDAEAGERLDRFVDVDRAVNSALVNGILPGVGIGLMTAGILALDEFLDEDAERSDILTDIWVVCQAPWRHLMLIKNDDEAKAEFLRYTVERDGKKLTGPSALQVTDLTTGNIGTPAELGIYDTAWATVTALKGALKTGKILATTSGILLGNKLNAVPYSS